MKTLFLAVLAGLILASIATWATRPEQIADRPILYWVTDPNPVRQAQVDAFHAWMQVHVPEAERFELRIDAANASPQKKIIQSVSGVGGDIMDTNADSGEMQYFRQMGIIRDLTDQAQAHGFSSDLTYPAIRPLMEHDGRQFMFPCNVFTNLYWVNRGALARHGLEVPDASWTFADFEREARIFVERANRGLQHPRFFYANTVDLLTLMRNRGLDILDETLSGCTLDDPALVESLRLLERWTYDLRILPSAADLQSITTEGAHGGSGPQMFRTGNYALYLSGRWALCQFREWPDFPAIELAILPPPDGGFQNTSAGSRAAVMYAGSRHPDLALHFFRFLASPEYSRTIVESGDALPPLPSAMAGEDYLRPAGRENEWPVHQAFAEGFQRFGIAVAASPFIANTSTRRELDDARQAVMARPSLYGPAEAAARAQRRINERIAQNLRENAGLVPAYEAARERQRQIEALKAAGRKIPRALISNDFHLRYYAAKGMLE